MCVLDEMLKVQARTKKHNTKYNADKFIDKLIASDKFDVLAEKLAEKAVEKMFKIQPNLTTTVSVDFKTDEKNVTLQTPQSTTANVNLQTNLTPKNDSSKKGIYFRETSNSLKNLSLKYKYFTKPAYSDEHKGQLDLNEHIHAEKATNNENESDDDSIDFSDLESSLQDKEINPNDNHKTKNIHSKEKKSVEHKIIVGKENESSISAENKKHDQIMLEQERNEADRSVDEISSGNSDFESKFNDKVFNVKSTTAREIEFRKPRQKRVHKEGNRLYTFQSSSDYEEYHQELARVEKKRPVFV